MMSPLFVSVSSRICKIILELQEIVRTRPERRERLNVPSERARSIAPRYRRPCLVLLSRAGSRRAHAVAGPSHTLSPTRPTFVLSACLSPVGARAAAFS